MRARSSCYLPQVLCWAALGLGSARLPHRATFKGTLGGDAVLCTDASTYSLKSVETTNSLMLVSDKEVRVFKQTPWQSPCCSAGFRAVYMHLALSRHSGAACARWQRAARCGCNSRSALGAGTCKPVSGQPRRSVAGTRSWPLFPCTAVYVRSASHGASRQLCTPARRLHHVTRTGTSAVPGHRGPLTRSWPAFRCLKHTAMFFQRSPSVSLTKHPWVCTGLTTQPSKASRCAGQQGRVA